MSFADRPPYVLKKTVPLLALLILDLATGLSAYAGPTTFTPQISIRQEYRDNLLFSRNKKGDFITMARAGMNIRRTTERMDARVQTSVNRRMFERWQQLDSTDKKLSASMNYSLTERTLVSGQANWSKEALWDNDIETTGLALTGDREQKSGSLSGTYMLTELSRIGLFTEVANADRTEDALTETTRRLRIGASYDRDISPFWRNTHLSAGLNFTRYISDTTQTWNTYGFDFSVSQEYISSIWQLTTGIARDLSETWHVSIQGGVNLSDTSESVMQDYPYPFASSTSRSEQTSMGGMFAANVSYDGETYNLNLGASHDIREGGNTNGTVERTSLTVNWNHRLTEDCSYFLNASCHLNQNEKQTTDDLDELTFSVQPGIRYRFNLDYIFRAGYRFSEVIDRQTDRATQSSLVYLQVSKDFIYDLD